MSKAHAFNAFKIAAKLTAIGMVAAEFYFGAAYFNAMWTISTFGYNFI